MKRHHLIILCLMTVLGGIFLAGPRVGVEHRPFTSRLPDDLSAYLANAEAAYSDITPGAEKTIIWAHPEH